MTTSYLARAHLKGFTRSLLTIAMAACTGLTLAQTGKVPLPREASGLSRAELVYITLLGEMQLQAGSSGAGFSLLLNAAKKSGDANLFKRAIQVALQSRAGDSALEAARAWAEAHPKDPEPVRFAIQALAGMDRADETVPLVEKLIDRVPVEDQPDVLNAVGQLFSQSKKTAESLGAVTPLLKHWQAKPETHSASLTALARIQMAAGRPEIALESLKQAMQSPKPAEIAALLAIDWLSKPSAPPEEWVRTLLQHQPQMFKARLAFGRQLLRQARWSDSRKELEQLVQEPDVSQIPPESWLMLGALQLQDKNTALAKTNFETFLQKVGDEAPAHLVAGRNQAYLSLAQIAEEGKDLEAAERWLDRVSEDEDPLRITTRRAVILVKMGRWQEAVQLIRALPDKPEDQNKARWVAEVQVLKEAGQDRLAYDRLSEALAVMPNDTEMLYEQATLAERLGRHSDMELLLRQVLRLEPDNHQAMNFLGYSMAERSDRLPEAKALIEQALSHAPNDPFITDSLGWVEFKMGNHTTALELLRKAFDNRPDGEIALHLAEVMWVTQNKEEALRMFRKANELQPGNPLLLPLVNRLGVPWP